MKQSVGDLGILRGEIVVSRNVRVTAIISVRQRVYGTICIHPKGGSAEERPEIVMVLSYD
jgi:hypothetical protein